ncbi:lipopolysaccharide assembly protein LapA domain-containing protein [Novipirellula artificiosorum]|uniref:Lipopolysaccharide assembly protein A domain-containing protein n=1 Tax=Novipirellula artificiosorum TaxID=2528016 RepID=A0A5C6CZX5_9BACT|nr:LapA family protein [Novipirellula artificiosorum]TWU29057.1 hypothetical protein Poly41_67560 [Novipirellula artificiosorum]
MMHYLTTSLLAIALVAIVIFATQNLQVVEVDFLFWSLKLSKFLIIIGAYVMGMLTGWGMVELVKRRFKGE